LRGITKEMSKTERNNWRVQTATVLLGIPFLIWAYIGTLARFSSDDFCWSMVISQRGFWGLQAHLYNNSYGRWASSLVLSALSYLGPVTRPVLPFIAIALCVVSLAWFSHALCRKWMFSLILAEILIAATFATAPRGAIEPLYWQSALLTYLPPLFIGPAGAALALRANSRILAALTGLIVCGFNEAITVMIVSGLVLTLPFAQRNRRGLLFSALAGSAFSFAVMLLSPGNTIRHNDPNPADYIGVLGDALCTIGRLLLDILTSPTGILLPAMGIILASVLRPNGKARLLVYALLCILAAIPAVAASLYGIKILMARTALIPTFALAASLLFIGLAIGSMITFRSSWLILVCAVLFSVASATQALSLLPAMRDFRRAWEDQNDLLTKSSPDSQVTLYPAPNPFQDSWQVRPERDWIINQCVATFYGVQSVQLAKEP
jgi:hypothetical protein